MKKELDNVLNQVLIMVKIKKKQCSNNLKLMHVKMSVCMFNACDHWGVTSTSKQLLKGGVVILQVLMLLSEKFF